MERWMGERWERQRKQGQKIEIKSIIKWRETTLGAGDKASGDMPDIKIINSGEYYGKNNMAAPPHHPKPLIP